MRKRIFIFLIASLLFIPIFARASSGLESPISVSLFAKKETEIIDWSQELEIAAGKNFNVLLIVKNNSNLPLEKASLEIEMPKEISYKGSLMINGSDEKQRIKKPINLGAFLPLEQKTIVFRVKTQNLNFNDYKTEITAKIFAGSFAALDSLQITLKPYNFQGIKLERRTGIAAVGSATKQWYFWIIFIFVLGFLFFRIFLKLFSSPMG